MEPRLQFLAYLKRTLALRLTNFSVTNNF